MVKFKLKSKEEIIQHLRSVKKRKEEWQEKAKADYNRLMFETKEEREQLHATVVG